MSISQELMYAILSMDSYNRGYNTGIAGLSEASDGSVQIGTATVSYNLEDAQLSNAAQAAGFYAVAYQWNGDTIISYRGTDNNFSIPWTDDPEGGSDLWNGYGTGAGAPITEQAKLAAEFFQAVTGTANGNPSTAGLATLIGHSLGGGLAGFIGALYKQNAFLFDNMPFELAANSAYTHANSGDSVWQPLVNDLYNGFNPWAPTISDNLKTYYVPGEFLELFRLLQNTEQSSVSSNGTIANLLTFLNPFTQLHSQALLVTLMYADQSVPTNDWVSIVEPIMRAFFNEEVSQQAIQSTASLHDADDVKSAIAYSALEKDAQGNGTLVFGNTGIRALFEDANAVGKAITEGKAPTGFSDTAPHLAEAIVQFGGQMALNHVDYTQHTDKKPEEGFLTVYENDRLLRADLTKGLWNVGGIDPNKPVEVVGIQSMLDPFFATDPAAAVLLASMQRLYGDATTDNSSVINRIDFALGTGALDVTLSEPEPNAETSNPSTTGLFVGLGTNDQVKGNKDHNMLLGRDGIDRLYGQEGKDILLGGAGDDILVGGSGDDVLHGGEHMTIYPADGTDTADYSQGDHGAPTPGAITVRLDLGSGAAILDKHPVWIENDGYGSKDYLYSIERIVGTVQNDTVVINGSNSVLQAASYAWTGGTLEIDGGAGEDTLDFSQFTGSLQIPSLVNGAGQAGDVSFKNFETVIDTESAGQVGSGSGSGVSLLQGFWNYIAGVQTIYGNGGDDTLVVGPDGELIDGGSGDDVLVAIQASDATLDGSSGDDIILSFGGADNDLFGGAGNDTLFSLTPGTRMTGGVGADTFYFSNHTLIEDATPEDHIKAFGLDLWGGQRWEASEDPWAYGAFLFRYGMNAQGDLVIESAFGKSLGWGATFVTNADVGPETPLSGRTAGLLVFEYDMERILLVNNDTGKGLYEFFQLVFDYMYKALLGVSLFEGVDPLVLDLDGDGLELTARTPLSPVFDLDGDGFAEQTGWVRPDDGLLVFDQNANGHIDDIGELFGNPGTSLGRSRCSSRQPIHFGFGQSGQSHVGRGGALRVPCVLRRHRRRTNWLRSDSVHLASGVGCTARPRHQAWGNPRRRRSLRRGGQKVGIPTTSQYPVSPGPTRMEERGDSLATRGPSAQGRGAGLSQETRRVGVQRPKV